MPYRSYLSWFITNEVRPMLFFLQIKFFCTSGDRSKYWRSPVLSSRNKIDDADISIGLMRVCSRMLLGGVLCQNGLRSIFRQCVLPFIFILSNSRGIAASSVCWNRKSRNENSLNLIWPRPPKCHQFFSFAQKFLFFSSFHLGDYPLFTITAILELYSIKTSCIVTMLLFFPLEFQVVCRECMLT